MNTKLTIDGEAFGIEHLLTVANGLMEKLNLSPGLALHQASFGTALNYGTDSWSILIDTQEFLVSFKDGRIVNGWI